MANSYQARNEILSRMGFDSYSEYLSSPLWKNIRRQVIGLRGKSCRGCGKAAQVIHHRDYDASTLRGHKFTGLVPLCRACHELIEFGADGTKLSLKQANRALDLLTKSKTKGCKPKSKKKPHKVRPGHPCKRCGTKIRLSREFCKKCKRQKDHERYTTCPENERVRPEKKKPTQGGLPPSKGPCRRCGVNPAARLSKTMLCHQCTQTSWRLSTNDSVSVKAISPRHSPDSSPGRRDVPLSAASLDAK